MRSPQCSPAIGAPLAAERVPLSDAAGRVLAEDIAARRDQPPFPASAMDGYAVRCCRCGANPDIPAHHWHQRGWSSLQRRRSLRAKPCGSSPERRFRKVPIASSSRKTPQSRDGTVIINEKPVPGQHRPPGRPRFQGRRNRIAGRPDHRRVCHRARRRHGTRLAAGAPETAGRDPRHRRRACAAGRARPAPIKSPRRACRPCWHWWTRPARRRSISVSPGTRSKPSKTGSLRAKAAHADILVTLGGASVGDHDLVQEALSRQGMSSVSGAWPFVRENL